MIGLQAGHIHRQHLLEPGAEREHLEATGIGERRSRPVHERPETTRLFDDVGAGLQVQVVGVGEHCLRAEPRHRFGQHRLDGGLGAYRDERGRPDGTVRGGDHPRPAESIGQPGLDLEAEPPRLGIGGGFRWRHLRIQAARR